MVLPALFVGSIPVEARTGDESAATAAPQPVVFGQGEGRLSGQVFDKETGYPLGDVHVGLDGTDKEDHTDQRGRFRINAVPAGIYTVTYQKKGYSEASVLEVQIDAGQTRELDFVLSYPPASASDDVVLMDKFTVTSVKVTQMMEAFEARIESEKLVNVFSAEEFSKFSAGDVADALKRVAGISVVEGQFAIIRGLEDRYSSVLYNGAPVPSPDPDRQSVQLDLFPSDVVGNLMVAKTFAGDLPSNSSGGSINIVTHDYPDEPEVKLSLGTGYNENAAERFIKLNPGSPMGMKTDGGSEVIENDGTLSIGGRTAYRSRELRYKFVFGQEVDYDTKIGWQEGREPQRASLPRPNRPVTPAHHSGDLSFGQLSLSDGLFELTESERTEQNTAYLGLGFNLDEAGRHKIDGSFFYTKKESETVQLKENGYFPNLDYTTVVPAPGDEFERNHFDGIATPSTWLRGVRVNANEGPSKGPLWFTNFNKSSSFEQERDLRVIQLNGDHRFEAIDTLHLSWAANQAKTTQDEVSFGAEYFYEPLDTEQAPTTFPTTPEALGPGVYAVNDGITYSVNDIDEDQDFGRIDGDYKFIFGDALTVKLNGGLYYEEATRAVSSSYLESPTSGGLSQFAILGETPEALGRNISTGLAPAPGGGFGGTRYSTNEAMREIEASHFGAKASFWKKVDLFGSVRIENILIESRNDPFTDTLALDGSPNIFPTKYLFFDRLDNPARSEVLTPPRAGTVFNDQILGIALPIDPVTGLVDLTDRAAIESLINGKIDEKKELPSAGFTWWVTGRFSLRGAYSETVARPSFREMGYYVSVEPGTGDPVVGNPQLQLSEVESWDARAEYMLGNEGDLIAASVFAKTITAPIESIVLRDPTNFEGSGALYRTFFNNPNEAELKGIEIEVRKNLNFVGPDFARYFTLGGNYTFIEAEVDRTDYELARATPFFGTLPADAGSVSFTSLEKSRRLYGQPEWITNIDLSFDQPDWGTKATLAFFTISDVLDAAGSASLGPDGTAVSYTLDRYIASYEQVDFIFSQKWRSWTFKFSVKNLTDSIRKRMYDPAQLTEEVAERSYTVDSDYSLSASYVF